jgi:hypothetical protein
MAAVCGQGTGAAILRCRGQSRCSWLAVLAVVNGWWHARPLLAGDLDRTNSRPSACPATHCMQWLSTSWRREQAVDLGPSSESGSLESSDDLDLSRIQCADGSQLYP